MRLRRNQWIQKCQAWKSRNVGINLGLDAELVKIYPLSNMKIKFYFKSLDDLWSIQYTNDMIKILKILNYYQLIGSVDFSLAIFTGAKMLDLEDIHIKQEFVKYLWTLRIPDIFDELDAAYLQRIDENYAGTDTFPQYEIFENFADWEIQEGF